MDVMAHLGSTLLRIWGGDAALGLELVAAVLERLCNHTSFRNAAVCQQGRATVAHGAPEPGPKPQDCNLVPRAGGLCRSPILNAVLLLALASWSKCVCFLQFSCNFMILAFKVRAILYD